MAVFTCFKISFGELKFLVLTASDVSVTFLWLCFWVLFKKYFLTLKLYSPVVQSKSCRVLPFLVMSVICLEVALVYGRYGGRDPDPQFSM